MTYNRITAEIGESRRITTRPISYQYDTVQILMLTAAEGVELPEFYQVDFCVIGDEDTVTMAGSLSGGAPIPDSLLRQGENLMAYLVLTGIESDVQTRYEITIPVNERPTRSGIELTDEQQAQVDSLVEALNEGVDRAEDAADAIENMGAEAETLPEGSEASVTKTVDPETGVVTLTFGIPKGAHGDPGYSPTIQIATITGGHRITVTDSQGSASFDVMDGEQGDPGTPGDDGYSPAVTITQITGGHRVTITDKTHQSGQTFDVMDGEQGDPGTPGDDGYSPAVTITTITGGHRVTITDKTHPSGQSFDVMDGASDAGQVSYDPTQTYQAGTVGKELSDQKNAISELDDALTHKFGDGGTVNSTLYDNSTGAVPPNTFSQTRRWFFNRVFAANESITSIKFDNYKLSSETTYFEIWEKNGNSLSKVKTVSIVTSGQTQFTVDIDYSGNAEYMLALVSTTGTVGAESRTGDWMLATTTISVDADSLNYSDLSVFTGFYPMVTIYMSTTYTQRVILIGEGQQYSEVQDALEGITDDSADNPYTFVLMPKANPYKPFSMLRSFDDPYPWSNIAPRYISIVGLDKAHCVVQSDSGDYRYPCCELMTNGIIKGIKFVMTNNAQVATATQGGYCAHIDCRTLNGVGYDMTLDDCDFEDASGPCLGIGMHQNCKLTIRRCNLHTTLDASYNPHSDYRNLADYGVIFCHTSTLATEINQQIVIEDCIGICDEGRRSLWISTAGDYDIASGYFHYTLIRNVFWNNEQDAPAYDISSGLIADTANACNNLDEYEQSNAIGEKITSPSSPTTGAFLVWNGTAWVAQTLATWQGGNY